MVSSYPVQFDVDYPSRPLHRLTTAFRFLIAIPIVVVLTMLSGSTFNDSDNSARNSLVIGGAAVFVPLVLMLVFRQKYPRWWFDWNLNLLRFSNRVTAYMALLDDRYPSTDEEQAVHLDFAYPDPKQLNRWLPVGKSLLPFTASYPKGLFRYVVGVLRWQNRVTAYAFTLVTDQYPPFSLS